MKRLPLQLERYKIIEAYLKRLLIFLKYCLGSFTLLVLSLFILTNPKPFIPVLPILGIAVFLLLFSLTMFLTLLALPKSSFRTITLEFLGWSLASINIILIISPIDVIPDFIPIIGQLDDLFLVIVTAFCVFFAYLKRKQRKSKKE